MMGVRFKWYMGRWSSKASYLEIGNSIFRTEVNIYNILVYAYDKKNHIFSEICFGQRKKAIKKKKAEPNDFFYGTIYQLKPDFL